MHDYVVLVHGLARTTRSMTKIKSHLSKKGYEVVDFNYPSTTKKIEDIAEQDLKKFLQEKCTNKKLRIHFITHSMGGIVVRFFLNNNKLENLGRIIMLAPPNQGSLQADVFSHSRIVNTVLGPALKQLKSGEEAWRASLNDIDAEIGIIAGKYDAKVFVEQTKLKNMKDFLILPKFHTFITRGRRVNSAIENFLEKGKFHSD